MTAVLALLAIAVTGCLASEIQIPEHDLLIGVYQPNSPGSYGDITAFESAAGLTPRITSYYTSSFGQAFPVSFAKEAAAQGTMVMVQWQPRETTNAAVAAGQEDAAIIAAAKAIASVNYQVIVSYGQEMNGDWYPWGDVAPSTPASFIAAWRHIWTIFQQQGVHNVTWLWDPNILYEGSKSLETWYPGDQYVTWVGLDGYFGQPTDTFESVFGPSISAVRAFTTKPMFIGETGVAGSTGAAQLESVFQGASLAGMIGVLYFDVAQAGDSMHQNWRLENNAANMTAFKSNVQLYATRPLIGTPTPQS